MKVNATFLAPSAVQQGRNTSEPSTLDFASSLGAARAQISAVAMTPQQELAEYLKKSPAEHMRDAILKEMGLTEEELAAMPPEQRVALEETIADKIKEKLLGSKDNAQSAGQALLAMVAFATDAQKLKLDQA